MTPYELWQIVRVGAPAVVPEGTLAVVPATGYDLETDESKTLLFAVRREEDGSFGEPSLLTNPDLGSATDPVIDRDGTRLAFVRPTPGHDQPQVHVTDLGVGEPLCVTDLPLGARDPRFVGDGSKLLCVGDVLVESPTVFATRDALANAPDRRMPRVTEDWIYRYWDHWLAGGVVPHLFLVDLETLAVRDLMPGWTRQMNLMEERGRYDVSPDGARVVFEADATPDDQSPVRTAIYQLEIASGELVCLTPDHSASDLRPRFTQDGAHVLFGRKMRPDYYADRVRLVRKAVDGGAEEVLTESWDRSVIGFEGSADGAVWLTADDRGRTHLYRLEAGATGEPARVAEGGAFGEPRVSHDAVWLLRSDLSSPPEVFVVDASGRTDQVTRFNAEMLDALSDRAPEVVEREVEAAPGEKVQAWVLLPRGRREGERLPLVHMIHGGPHSFFGDAFHFRWCARVFASWGYAVALVNFHGSEGFGTAYRESILGAWGDKPARDVLAVTDHLVEEGLVDPERMAITGGSFGGYLTAWIATQTNRFKCGVSHAGVFDSQGDDGQRRDPMARGRLRGDALGR